jgi:hypothetical protein
MPETQHAHNACRACKLRKKACDKALPTCSFCVQRHFHCFYKYARPEIKRPRKYNPGKHFVSLGNLSESDGSVVVHPRNLPSLEQASFGESINRLVRDAARLTQLSIDAIITHYFQLYDSWLPVISTDIFGHEIPNYRAKGHFRRGSSSVLFLAMLLNVLPSLDDPSRPSRDDQEFLYRATKSAVAGVLASGPCTLSLVQTSYLLAMREYTCTRLEAAYISITTCGSMANILSLKTPDESTSHEETVTQTNLMWAIAMLDR